MEFLTYLSIVLVIVLSGLYCAHKTGLTPVLWYIFLASLLVNIGILPVDTHPFIQGFSELGIITIMFALGFEESPDGFLASVKRSWGIALFGAVVPFCMAFTIAQYFWGNFAVSLLAGLTMTATAVSLTMMTLKGEGLEHSRAASGIMASAVLDSVSSLAIVAILVPFATGELAQTISEAAKHPGLWSELYIIGSAIGLILVKALLFFAIVTVLGIWIFPTESQSLLFRKFPVLRSFGIRHLLSFNDGKRSTLVTLTLAVVISMTAEHFGIHYAVGAYMAGLILRKEDFHLDIHGFSSSYEYTKKVVDDIAFTWIGPIFFVVLGTKLVFNDTSFLSIFPFVLILTLGLASAQIISAALAARITGKFEWFESVMIGFGMLGRAELAFVVLDIGYVQYNIFPDAVFYTLMCTAFVLNALAPLAIKWWKPYYFGEKKLFVHFAHHYIRLSAPPELHHHTKQGNDITHYCSGRK